MTGREINPRLAGLPSPAATSSQFTCCRQHRRYQAQPQRRNRAIPILIPPLFHFHLPAVISLFCFCSLAHPVAGQEEGRGMRSAHSHHHVSPLRASPPAPWLGVRDPHHHAAALTAFWGCAGPPTPAHRVSCEPWCAACLPASAPGSRSHQAWLLHYFYTPSF